MRSCVRVPVRTNIHIFYYNTFFRHALGKVEKKKHERKHHNNNKKKKKEKTKGKEGGRNERKKSSLLQATSMRVSVNTKKRSLIHLFIYLFIYLLIYIL